MEDDALDLEDVPESQRFGAPARPITQLDRILAGQDRMEARLVALEAAEQRRAGATTVWRWLGGAAATVALGLATAALSLGADASRDHERLDRVERTQDEHLATEARRDDDVRDALADSTAAVRETKAVVERVEGRVERIERALDARRGGR